ncbi:MAG TPA: transporter [Candidatus Acidoferrum sp.]|nr:transporter [Candidatus Acidoferrum sp.]
MKHHHPYLLERFSIFIFLFFFLFSPVLFAQCRDSDFPGADGVAAAPSRPVESSSPDPIQTGVSEFETGFARTWYGADASQNLFSNLVKLGVWCNMEVRWSANSFVSNNTPVLTNSGFGDNFLAGQYRFHRETAALPSMALGYTVKFDSGSPAKGVGSGSVDHLFMFMLGKTVHKFSVVANVNFFEIGQGHGNFDHKTEFTLEASHPLKGHWGVLGEVYYDTHLNPDNAAFGNSTWGLTYTLNPRCILDGGAYLNLTSGPGAPGKAAFLGVSYAFANLYPKHRVPVPPVEE